MRTNATKWASQNIEVQEILPGQWRLTDAEQPEADGLAVFGFVEITDRGYESTPITHSRNRPVFATLDQAVAFLINDHRRAPS
jgi:hypothetical protein